MAKTTIIIQIEDGDNIYKIGDSVRVKMKPSNPEKPEWANEYIGNIIDIKQGVVVIDAKICTRELPVEQIDRMRFAKIGESFENTWNFDVFN